jgi:hypothetical protein
MGQYATAFVPDSYLFWRLAMLAEAGQGGIDAAADAPPNVALR